MPCRPLSATVARMPYSSSVLLIANTLRGVVVDHEDVLAAQIPCLRTCRRRARPGRRPRRRPAGAPARPGRRQVQRDPLAQLVKRGQQLQRPVAGAQRGDAIGALAAGRPVRCASTGISRQFGLFLQPARGTRSAAAQTEIDHHAAERLGGQQRHGLVRAGRRDDPHGRVRCRPGRRSRCARAASGGRRWCPRTPGRWPPRRSRPRREIRRAEPRRPSGTPNGDHGSSSARPQVRPPCRPRAPARGRLTRAAQAAGPAPGPRRPEASPSGIGQAARA